MLADQLDYVIGVDPHRDTHALAIVDVRTGGIVLETSVPANSSGYARALELAELHAHPVDDPSCVLLEVDAIDERAWRESGPVEDDELELLGQWPLLSRRGVTVPDAAMDEDNTLHSRGLAPRSSFFARSTSSPRTYTRPKETCYASNAAGRREVR